MVYCTKPNFTLICKHCGSYWAKTANMTIFAIIVGLLYPMMAKFGVQEYTISLCLQEKFHVVWITESPLKGKKTVLLVFSTST